MMQITNNTRKVLLLNIGRVGDLVPEFTTEIESKQVLNINCKWDKISINEVLECNKLGLRK